MADAQSIVVKAQACVSEVEATGQYPAVLASANATLAEAQAYASVPSLPSWVPAPGTFAEFTLNKPMDVGMQAATINYWCSGAFIADYGPYGAIAYHGGRDHNSVPANAQQAVYVLDLEARLYERKCYPIESHMQAKLYTNSSPPPPLTYIGTPSDDWGAYPDGSSNAQHTYANLCEMPVAWGGGPKGSLVRVAESGGASKSKVDAGATDTGAAEGNSATWRFDLSKAEHTLADPATMRLTGDQLYHFRPDNPNIVACVTDAITACIDRTREGWWAFQRTMGTPLLRGLSFTSKTGVVTNFAARPVLFGFWSKMHHFADDDLLCVLSDEISWDVWRFGTVKLLNLNSADDWVTIIPTLPDDVSVNWTKWGTPPDHLSCGYGGPTWCQDLDGGCFVMLDFKNPSGIQSQLRVWKLTPPPPGQRFTGTWAWTVETVTSSDGSTVNVRVDVGSSNGALGRLIECPALRSLVWTRSHGQKGQLIRLQGM